MCSWRNANMGTELLWKVCTSGKLGKCEIASVFCKDSQPIYFVLAFPQADLDVSFKWRCQWDLFHQMISSVENICCVWIKLCMVWNKLRTKWYKKLRSGLCSRGFVQSQVDLCVFFGDGRIVLTYVDDVIISSTTISGNTWRRRRTRMGLSKLFMVLHMIS